jgi:hypothetical protein
MILLAGQIESIASRKDKTVKLTIGTQELHPSQAAELFTMNQQFTYIGLKPEPFTKDEEEKLSSLKTELDTQKTPAQRLRGILYRNFEQNSKGYTDFNNYYQSEMERICEHYKSKLE